jgi:3-deoxy-D-manno-octulosonate 8-phosphate phosphatase (KDO 8-P phosphatase)
MVTPAEIEAAFTGIGGIFVRPPAAIAARLGQIRALVFDWDGVFNDGYKGVGLSSGFSEADSMGVNMLRYGFWRRDGRLPSTAIITGEVNASAEAFAQREHFDALFMGIRDKREVLAKFCEQAGLAPAEVACMVDDINDVGLAGECGLRILIRRDASVLLRELLARTGRCEYISGCVGGAHAIRESAELLLGLMGLFEETVESRCANDRDYRKYFEARQAVAVVEHRASPR